MYSYIDYIYGVVTVIVILGVFRLFISTGDEYHIPSTNKKLDDSLNGLTKLGRLLYKLKGMNDKKKVRILHPIGCIVFILMMIIAIPLCLFKPFTIFDILTEFTLL